MCPSVRTCYVTVQTCHVSSVWPATWQYGLPSQHQIFACLTFRTERDIFSIRAPFDIKIIPPESGRRDGRNGIGFVAFRALSFLSIFQALSGCWICFQITPPHNKTFWSPKGYCPVNKSGIGHPACPLSLNSVLCTCLIKISCSTACPVSIKFLPV
jgi:hypothetical protein